VEKSGKKVLGGRKKEKCARSTAVFIGLSYNPNKRRVSTFM
jgi:hypothetical protein